MTFSIRKLFFFSLLAILICSSQSCNDKKKFSIVTDNFPELKFDSVVTDTHGIRRLIKEALNSNHNDSIQFILDCIENAKFDNLIFTSLIIQEEIDFSGKDKNRISIYSKCNEKFGSLFVPFEAHKINPEEIIQIYAAPGAKLILNNDTISSEFFCKKFRGQLITVDLAEFNILTNDQLTEILDLFSAEKFRVILSQKR